MRRVAAIGHLGQHDRELAVTEPRDGAGEIQLTNGLRTLRAQRPMYGYRFEGVRHDAGNKLGFLKAVVYFALRRPDLADATSQSRSRLSHQISRMEKRGLVRRDDCEGDKRGTFAVLTKAGFQAIERVAPYHVENVRRHFIDRLSARQQEEIRSSFQPIVDYLRKIRDRD